MPTFEIPDHFSKHFTTNVELLLQETKPVMLEGVMTSSYRGEAAQVIKQFGEVEFTEKTGRHSDTVFSDIEHKQRWVFPTDYTLTLPVDKEDDLRALNSPTSSYAEAMRAAWARKVNATIRDALLGNSQTGTNGSTVTPFDTVNQQIAPNATGLTLDKLRAARKIFTENFVEPSDKLFLTLNAKGTEDLLAVSEIGSIDYNAVKALVRGEVNDYMGFRFIQYQSLTATGTDDRVIAWAKSGINYAIWNGLETRIDERKDKEYTTQVFMRGTIGATRTQEGKVIEILTNQ